MTHTAQPIYCPQAGCRNFSVSVYNAEVRKLVKENRSHAVFDDLWADEHRQVVVAEDEAEARNRAQAQYPPEQGFVITAVKPLGIALG